MVKCYFKVALFHKNYKCCHSVNGVLNVNIQCNLCLDTLIITDYSNTVSDSMLSKRWFIKLIFIV